MEKNRVNNIKKALQNNQVFIVSHRGRFGGCIVENTLEAFDLALKAGADIIEADIAKLADGEFVIFHDEKLDRITNQSGPIAERTYEEMKQIKLLNSIGEPSYRTVNTLDEFLEHFKDRCLINLDRCEPYLNEVYDKVRSYGMQKQILLKSPLHSSKSIEWLKSVKDEMIFIPIIYSDEQLVDLYNLLEVMNIQVVEVVADKQTRKVISKEFIEDMHQRGIKVWVNALTLSCDTMIAGEHDDNMSLLESPDAGWGWLVERGVDIIQTDWVSELKDYLESIGKH